MAALLLFPVPVADCACAFPLLRNASKRFWLRLLYGSDEATGAVGPTNRRFGAELPEDAGERATAVLELGAADWIATDAGGRNGFAAAAVRDGAVCLYWLAEAGGKGKHFSEHLR